VVPLIVLIGVALLARLAGYLGVRALSNWTAAVRVALATMFCVTASAHFNSMRGDLVRMVPPSIPKPELMVTITGICEILGAIGLLLRPLRRIAAGGLVAMLVAVLPANIHAAQSGITLDGAPPTPLVPRIALQVLFLALLWWTGWRRRESRRPMPD
jgi:uncharacterized membrane protein